MDYERYLKKLSRNVHWKFPRKEAEDIVNDYRALLSDSQMHMEDLLPDIGTPFQAVRHLGNHSSYKLWIVVFALMLFCLAGLVFELYSSSQNRHWDAFLLSIGLIVPVVWFWRTEKGYRYHDSIPLVIPALIFVMAALLIFGCQLFRSVDHSPSVQIANWFRLIVKTIGLLTLFPAVAGLILAKLRDRRWCALYTAALTVLAGSVFLFSILHDINLDKSILSWWVPYLWKGGFTIFAGFLATFCASH